MLSLLIQRIVHTSVPPHLQGFGLGKPDPMSVAVPRQFGHLTVNRVGRDVVELVAITDLVVPLEYLCHRALLQSISSQDHVVP